MGLTPAAGVRLLLLLPWPVFQRIAIELGICELSCSCLVDHHRDMGMRMPRSGRGLCVLRAPGGRSTGIVRRPKCRLRVDAWTAVEARVGPLIN